MKLIPNWDWALAYTGDPQSWEARGEAFVTFLKEEGLTPNDRVLEIGCGNLSAGVPLIRYLRHGNYVGVDPNGWLINAAVERFPDLASKNPAFLYRSDFEVVNEGMEPFQYILAHSVLSHVAHWQMPKVLWETRRVVERDAVFLASVRLDQYDDFARQWAYPGVNKFRLETIEAFAFHAGWVVQRKHGMEKRLQEVAPNDIHEILKLTAALSPQDANVITVDLDVRDREHAEVTEIAEGLWAERERVRMGRLAAEQTAVEEPVEVVAQPEPVVEAVAESVVEEAPVEEQVVSRQAPGKTWLRPGGTE